MTGLFSCPTPFRKLWRVCATLTVAALVTSAVASGPYPLVFVSSRDGSQELWTAMSDGTGLKKLTQTGGGNPFPGKRIGAYALSPDGTKVVFGEPGAYVANLWVYDIPSDSFRQLTTDGQDNTIPSWSPDGKRIVYVKANGTWEIFSIGLDQLDIVQHTDGDEVSTHPSYSPDGAKIVMDRGGNPARIVLQDADGLNKNTVELTSDIGGHSFHPAFSPDGTRIAFGHEGPFATYDLWVMNADGSNKQQLTQFDTGSGLTGRGITWTPDGAEILFAAFDGAGTESIYAYDIAASVVRRVTSGAEYDTYPAFSQTPDVEWPMQPETYVITRGYWYAGNLESLKHGDDNRLVVTPRPGLFVNDPPIEVEVGAKSPILAPSRLDLTVEAMSTIIPLVKADIEIQLYSYANGQWITFYKGHPTATDSRVTVYVTSDNQPFRFIEQSTGHVAARVRWLEYGAFVADWKVGIDQVTFVVHQ